MSGQIPPTRRGYDAREVVSALQKAIRRSDPDAALYWGFELARSGFGAWLWKRLRIIAVEDCSPEAVGLVADVHALNAEWVAAQKGRSDGHEILFVARALISLAIAPKSRVVDWSVWRHANDHVPRREIPDEALDKHTARGRRMCRGDQHFLDEASRLEPWTGSLDDLEAGYREDAERMIAKDPDQPHNPWRGSPNVGSANVGKPGQNSEPNYGQVPGQIPLQMPLDQPTEETE